MKAPLLLLTLATLLTITACSPKLTPFTQDLYDEQNWSDAELKRIQFYLSEDIVLRRQISRGSSEISRGEIKIVDGKKVEEIVIKRGTPGVFIFRPKDDRFAVSFEGGSDDRFLVFGPSKRNRGRYTLRARDWRNRRNGGEITYDGRVYYTPSNSAYATLMVDLKKIRSVKVKSRTAGGRKVRG